MMSPFDSPQKTTTDERNSTSPNPSGDVLLKWGHRKRSRASRASIEFEDSSSSIHTNKKKNMIKVLPSKLSSSPSMPPPPPTTSNRRMPSSERLNIHHNKDSGLMQSENEGKVVVTTNPSANGEDKVTVEVIEWPRIYISLSRKEKEDDFLAMKGTKIPQRPKKRAKNIDRTLQYCFPGMWLSDLTKSRYEVRENKKKNKSVKKQKRRGLKGMENLESGSE